MVRKYFETSEKKWNAFKGALIAEHGTITKGMDSVMTKYLEKKK